MNRLVNFVFVLVMLALLSACSTVEVESGNPVEDVLGSWHLERIESEDKFWPAYNPLLNQQDYYVFSDSNLRMIMYPCYHVRDVGYELETDSLFMLIGQNKASFKFYLTCDTLKLTQDGLHGISTLVFARDDSFKEYNSFREHETYYAGNCFTYFVIPANPFKLVI